MLRPALSGRISNDNPDYVNDPRLEGLYDAKPGAGAKSWGILHLMAMDGKLDDASLRRFIQNIGCPDCRRSFVSLLASHPMPAGGAGAKFEWTWRMHNLVNRKTLKPQVSLAKAMAEWASGGLHCTIEGGKCDC